MNVILPFSLRPRHEPTALQHAIDQKADTCHGADVAVGFFEHPEPAQQLVPDTVLQLLHNTVATKSAEAMVAAALKSWMDGDPLTAREQRIVDVVCDTNYASQIGRLCLPAS